MNERHANQKPPANSDVFARMRADHRRVLEDLTRMAAHAQRLYGASNDRRADELAIREVAERLEAQFQSHMLAEDEVLFPALTVALPTARESILPLRGEHDELRTMLTAIRAMLDHPAGAMRNERLAVDVQDFVDLLRIHIRKEEAVVLSVAERLLKPREIERIAERLSRGPEPSDSRPSESRRKGQIDEC